MVENVANSPLLSVQILLPESIDSRLEQRTEEIPGASWPTWGGHITLVPQFRARTDMEEILAILGTTCAGESPFALRFGEPVAVNDMTRPGYFAVLLTIDELSRSEDAAPELDDRRLANHPRADVYHANGVHKSPRLNALRSRILLALQSLRDDLRPQLVEQPFMPHVTLALGLGESEARTLVQGLRSEPIVGDFEVEVIWLVTRIAGDVSAVARHPIPLGRVVDKQSP